MTGFSISGGLISFVSVLFLFLSESVFTSGFTGSIPGSIGSIFTSGDVEFVGLSG